MDRCTPEVYSVSETGQTLQLLLVHCADDMHLQISEVEDYYKNLSGEVTSRSNFMAVSRTSTNERAGTSQSENRKTEGKRRAMEEDGWNSEKAEKRALKKQQAEAKRHADDVANRPVEKRNMAEMQHADEIRKQEVAVQRPADENRKAEAIRKAEETEKRAKRQAEERRRAETEARRSEQVRHNTELENNRAANEGQQAEVDEDRRKLEVETRVGQGRMDSEARERTLERQRLDMERKILADQETARLNALDNTPQGCKCCIM